MSFDIGYIFKTENFKINNEFDNSLDTKSDFEILKILGSGSYARVNQVKHLQSNKV